MATEYEIYKEGGLLNYRYQKLEDISKGAYGIVSLAKDIHKQKLVAVKYIFKLDDEGAPKKKDYANFSKSVKKMDSDVCEEALHEIAIHENLGHHKYIIEFVDCFNSFIILEYCSRGDLYEAIHADAGPSSTRDIVNVMLQLIDAVEFAHSKSIYHRDIKPENILIANDYTIRLSDWGLASQSRYCNDFGVGSERYMAPELFDEINLRVYDAAKCDVWSIGICLLNLVFKKSPFTKANEKDKSFSYFACNREALFDIFSTMSMDLFTVLRYSLTIDPDNRDLSKMKEELLNVQSFTIDDDLELIQDEIIPAAKPMDIGPSSKVNNEKIFATQTPNTHITDHFQQFRKELFNRKDYFTPPSAASQYLDNYLSTEKSGIYHPPHQRPTTPKSAGHLVPPVGKLNRPRRSFNSFSHHTTSSGKYVPPNLRSPAAQNGVSTGSRLSQLSHMPVFEDDKDESSSSTGEDDMFLLEESGVSNNDDSAQLNNTAHLMNHLNLEDFSDVSSSVTSLMAPIQIDEGLLVNDKLQASGISDRRGSDNSNASSTTGKKAYVPPHHRENFQSQWNKSAWSTFNNNYNKVHEQRHFRGFNHQQKLGRRYSVPASRTDFMSNSVPTQNGNWLQYSNNKSNLLDEYAEEDFEVVGDEEYLDDEDLQGTHMYEKFASRVGTFTDLRHAADSVSRSGGINMQKVPDTSQVGS